MKPASGLASLLLVAACVACTTHVRVEFDPRQDFSHYDTWAWLPLRREAGDARCLVDPELDALVRSSVERELGARGYRRAAGLRPDFYVAYHVEILREIMAYTETPASQTLSSHHQSPSYTVSASVRRIRVYEKGTLAVAVADGRELRPVWRGVETRRVRRSFKQQADAAVAEIFEHFPPRFHPQSRGDSGQRSRESGARRERPAPFTDGCRARGTV